MYIVAGRECQAKADNQGGDVTYLASGGVSDSRSVKICK